MDKVGEVEFGNWLIGELKKEKLLSKPVTIAAPTTHKARVAALQGGKKLLLEFLLYQEQMMQRASG